jgi:hypothetical protein
MQPVDYIGLGVRKRAIHDRVEEASRRVYAEGSLPTTRCNLDH